MEDRALLIAVEILDQKRAPQGLEALYFIQPTAYNIDCIKSDYTVSPVRYTKAHIITLPGLTDELYHEINSSVISRYLKQTKQVFLDVLPFESQIYHFDDPHALQIFYNENCSGLVKLHVDTVARKLASLCILYDDYPVIRHYRPENANNASHILPTMIADRVQSLLDKYAASNRDFPKVDSSKPRSTFVIVDRTLDLVAPLVHEFTYQAMAYDLLAIKDHRYYEYSVPSQPQKMRGKLSDSDSQWMELRHLHIAEASQRLDSELKRLREENPQMDDSNSPAGAVSVSQVVDMLLSVPMFKDKKEQFSLHINMAAACLGVHDADLLNYLSEIEQTLATGLTSEGKKPKGITNDVVNLLAEPKLSNPDKVRLVLLYALHRQGLVRSDFVKLRFHSRLQDEDIFTVQNIAILDGPVLKPSLHKSELKNRKFRRTFQGTATGDVYETSRYIPGLKTVLDLIFKGQMQQAARDFPYTKAEPIMDEDEANQLRASLRNPKQKASWAKGHVVKSPQQRVFVYVAGGFTLSEARAAYELSSEHGKDIILGGDCILTPDLFLRSLLRLGYARERLELPVDERKPRRAPEILFASAKKKETPTRSQPNLSEMAVPTGVSRPGPAITATDSGSDVASLQSSQTQPEPIKDKKKKRLKNFFK